MTHTKPELLCAGGCVRGPCRDSMHMHMHIFRTDALLGNLI